MQQIDPDQLSPKPLPGEEPHIRLAIGDEAITLPGVRIELAFRLDQGDPIRGYLFFSNDGDLFEEVQTITLTDHRLRLLDRVWIGSMYGNAQLDGARIDGPGRLDFGLQGNGLWRLTVLPRLEWRLPLPTGDGVVWRGLWRFRRHVSIRQIRANG